MDLNYPEECYSKSSSEETDPSSEQNNDDHNIRTGRSYECIFCKRGFTTAQALGGHMNIHRKDRANKTKPTFPPPSSSNKVDDLGFYSEVPSHSVGGSCYSTAPVVDANSYHQVYFPHTRPPHVQYDEVLSVENQPDHHQFAQDWRKINLSLYTNPLCVHEIKDKFEDSSEEDGLDLELRLGQNP